MRARSCSSLPGIAVQGGLGSAASSEADALHALRNAYFHVDNSPVAAAALSSFAGSRGLYSRAAAHTGSDIGGGRGFPGGGQGVILAVGTLSAISAFFFLRSGRSSEEEENLPESVDWSEMGAVTGVKSQGPCGNCWAHATVGAIEGCYQIETGKLVELSVQQVTDCASLCFGCEGGNLPGAFWYALSGIATVASYPQRLDMWHGGCRSKGMTPTVKISRFSITDGTEESLMRAVAKQPVAICLNSHEALTTYTGGVMIYEAWPTVDNPECRHAVLVVGYDTDEFGVKFWKLKNSWGPNWGEGGYFRIRRGVPTKHGVGGIRKGCGFYPHMTWFGKKSAKGSSVTTADEVVENGEA